MSRRDKAAAEPADARLRVMAAQVIAQRRWPYVSNLLFNFKLVEVVLSFSRDPFCCYVTNMDAATFWGCHARAFGHFGGVAGSIVYDRVATIVRRHVRAGCAGEPGAGTGRRPQVSRVTPSAWGA